MATAMDDGDGDGNGRQRGQRQWQRQWLTAMQQRRQRRWSAATTIAMGNGNGNEQWQRQWLLATELAMTTEMATAIAMATATARVTMTKTGRPLHVPVMCSAMAGATPCLHPHGHKGKCIHQHCVMGVTLLRVFPPFQGGGFLT